MAIVRRRGTAIVEMPKGILVASGRHKVFLLPGGGAEKWESRRKATIRELREETGLKAHYWKYLFTYNEPKYTLEGKKRKIVNLHKVFLIRAHGHMKPNHHDVKHIAFWKPRSNVNLSRTTKLIIDKYLDRYR
jgi:ADP-ribose pyrophosphatase YjhB (NUDIX family)